MSRPRDADTKDMVTIFAREVAPLAANETMFVNNKNRKASLIGEYRHERRTLDEL